MAVYRLVADIGGTNARFALLEGDSNTPVYAQNLVCADYPDISDAIQSYLSTVSFAKPKQAAIAVATAVTGDELTFTNNPWSFSINETCQRLQFDQLKVINDFTGLALAIPHLNEDEFQQVGGGQLSDAHAKAVIGPGTGLGVSGALPINGCWYPLQGEGGHVSYGPLTDDEAQVITEIRKQKPHVSAEILVSGSGLALLYQTLSTREGFENKVLLPEEVSQKALDRSCPIAEEALSMFCGILGSVAGNLALTLGARGGVYIGGGIVPKVIDYFMASPFRQRFEKHDRFAAYLAKIPSFVVTAKYPALNGAALSLKSEYANIGVSSQKQ